MAAEPPPRAGRSAPREVRSPEILENRQVAFRIFAPAAGTVRLGGSDLGSGGDMELTRGTNGVWEVVVGPLAPGSYRYHFNVDGLQVIDPLNPRTSESNANTWSLVHVPGAEYMDTRPVPRGAVSEVTYFSATLDRFRRLHVYTPPGYETGTDPLPILYLLHGAFDSDDSWTTVGRAGFIMDNLIADGLAEPMIVVMPAGHTGPFRFGSSAGDAFERDFVNEIMPQMERRYRVRADRDHRAIAGLSMGGAQTLNIFASRMQDFGYVGVFSSGVFGIAGRQGRPGDPGWEQRHREALENAHLRDGLRLVWFATGKDDFLLETTKATVEMLRRHGFDVEYRETEGAHTWHVWREYLREFAQKLFRAEADTDGDAAGKR